MTVRKTVGTVGTLAQEAVSTAVSVAKHPIGSTALAAGLVKGAAGAGIGLLRDTISGGSPTPPSDTPVDEAPAGTFPRAAEEPEPATLKRETPEPQAPETSDDPRDNLPGPDLAHFEPPSFDDLPEPVVIEADDAPANGESGEPFHNEPKAASRASEHGGPAGDREESDGYVEEIPPEQQP
jgi:hypothetical protein